MGTRRADDSSSTGRADSTSMPDAPGLHRLAADLRGAIAATASAHGFALLTIDLQACSGKTDFLQRIAAALQFPAWFGHNWDALADCLGDLSWLPARGHVLVLEHADDLRRAAPLDFATAQDILDEACRERTDDGTPMWVYLVANDDPCRRAPP
ncbi:MAG TPA: barstar family protein [Rhodocyclaceae bacterium]|nr:barstar family protein [Rhodocyclaceae bacterium]